MSCNAAYSLGAALRACGLCAPISPARKWVLADKVTADRCAPGMEVLARLDGVPATDSRGRKAHVRGIYLNGGAVMTIAGATNAAISAYQMRAIWSAMFLEDVAAHQYWSGVDGRTILDDQFYRFWRIMQWPKLAWGVQGSPFPVQSTDEGLLLNAGIGEEVVSASLYAPLTRPAGIDGSPLEGLIPLAALQRLASGGLRIRIRQSMPGAPAGSVFTSLQVTNLDGTSRPGFDIWLDVVYLPAFVVDAAYQLEEYPISDQTGMLRHPDRLTEYAWIRYWPEDTSAGSAFTGQNLAEAHDGITLRVAGMTEMASMPKADAWVRGLLAEQSEIDSSLATNNPSTALPQFIAAGPATLMLLPFRVREASAAGPVSYEYATRDALFTRYVHRTVSCHSQERGDKLAERLQCDPCTVAGTNGKGAAQPTVSSYEPAIVVPQSSRPSRM